MARESLFYKHKEAHPHLQCRVCGNENSLIRSYNILMCRRCFRENAAKIGFVKYN